MTGLLPVLSPTDLRLAPQQRGGLEKTSLSIAVKANSPLNLSVVLFHKLRWECGNPEGISGGQGLTGRYLCWTWRIGVNIPSILSILHPFQFPVSHVRGPLHSVSADRSPGYLMKRFIPSDHYQMCDKNSQYSNAAAVTTKVRHSNATQTAVDGEVDKCPIP